MKTNNEIIELKEFKAINGRHCESTSIINALNYQRLILSEAMINGLGSAISFTYINDNGFPFLGVRCENLLKNFLEATGLECRDHYPDTAQEAYDEVKAVLKKNIPVVIQLDMRYLPYRWGGKYGSKYQSFGAHFVTLIKIDEKKGFVWVTETNEPGVNVIEKLKINDFMKARGSKGGMKTLWPKYHYYYFISPEKTKIDYKKSFKVSLKNTIKEYSGDRGVIKNLKEFPGQVLQIEKNAMNKYMLETIFFTMHGWIEDFGTGGSGFRNFYRDFLKEIGNILQNDEIVNVSKAVDSACKEWKKLADEADFASKNIKKYLKDEEKRKELYNEMYNTSEKIYESEVKMFDEIEKLNKKH